MASRRLRQRLRAPRRPAGGVLEVLAAVGRIWTTYRGIYCVLIASLTGDRTRLNCDGRTSTL
jgi:hypothetical protein